MREQRSNTYDEDLDEAWITVERALVVKELARYYRALFTGSKESFKWNPSFDELDVDLV